MREIKTYKRYFLDFYNSLPEKAQQKKTQKTPTGEIEKAKRIMREYYGSK